MFAISEVIFVTEVNALSVEIVLNAGIFRVAVEGGTAPFEADYIVVS